MIRRAERLFLDGAAGRLAVVVDEPASGPRGVALVAHPHPLFGGTPDNKVVQTLAKTFAELGYVAMRPGFRGVDGSEGTHDYGDGETEDMVRVVDWASGKFGALPVVLAGFSFGAYVQSRVAQRLKAERLVLIGVPYGLVAGGRTYQTERVPPDTIVIHGEQDETAPLANVFEWARPQELPVVVVPGADHFFHHRLRIISQIVKAQWWT